MATKSNGTDATEWARAPPSGPLWRRILTSIYNPKEKSFLGRTAKRWGIVVTFYLVFYAVLALLFGICMGGLFLTLDANRPTYTLQGSLIGANPGVTFRPRPSDGVSVRYDRNNASSYEDYTTQLEEFLKPYENESWVIEEAGCSTGEGFGYPDTPCFFIKLNKIFDWVPEFYDDPSSLPADMPDDLVQHIKDLDSPLKRKKIWVSCQDEKGNSTSIGFPWGRGLPDSFYPYRNEQGYRSPLVAVKLATEANTLTTVRCRAWAKNIIHNKSIKEASGYARITLYIEDNTTADGGEVA